MTDRTREPVVGLGGGGGNQIKIASTVINDQLVYVNNIHFPQKLIYFSGDGRGEGDAYRCRVREKHYDVI